MDGSTHACKMEQCGGGVGRNMAEALWRLRGGRTKLLTTIGNDTDGEYLANIAPGLILDGCVVENARTSMYAAVFDIRGECVLGLGDMDIHENISIELVDKHVEHLVNSPLVVIDGNVPQATINYVLKLCRELKKPVFFEPTDRRKAIKPLQDMDQLMFSSPNISELRAMAAYLKPNYIVDTTTPLAEIIELSKIVSQYINIIIITMGSAGVVIVQCISDRRNYLRVRFYSIEKLSNVENVSGAGDCFSSGFIHGILLGLKESQCVSLGFEAAKYALHCKNTVPTQFHMASNIKEVFFKTWNFYID